MAKKVNKKLDKKTNSNKKIIIIGIILLIIAILVFKPSIGNDIIDQNSEKEEILSEDTSELINDHLDEALDDIDDIDPDLL